MSQKSKSAVLPCLSDFVTTAKGRKQVLAGEIAFPLRVQPDAHLRTVMVSDLADGEKLFRLALKEKQYGYARKLVENMIVPRDRDLIFNCCHDPQDDALQIFIDYFWAKDLDSVPVGVWGRTLSACLHVLFLSELTPLRRDVITMLSKVADINAPYNGSNIFTNLLFYTPKLLTLEKVEAMIDAGFEFSSQMVVHSIPNYSPETVLNHLTRGVDLDLMIEILRLIKERQ